MPFSALFRDKSSKDKDVSHGMSRQRQTALSVIDAFNRLDTTAVWKARDRSCWREIYPKSLGAPPQDNNSCQQALNMLANTFKDLHMSVHEIIEDKESRKVCMWIICTGRTISGPFTNEYVWSLEFDETGTQIIRWKEFADAISTKALYPELMAAEAADPAPISRTGTPSVPTRADSMVSTASQASSALSSSTQGAAPTSGPSSHAGSAHTQPPLPHAQPLPSSASSSSQQQPGSKPGTPRPNSQLPPPRPPREPQEIVANGRTLALR